MKNEAYLKVAERYGKKYDSFGDKKGCGRFSDIWNQINALEFLAKEINFNPDRDVQECKTRFLFHLRITRTYFRLLEKHPEFREAEINEEKGFFPDIDDYVMSYEGVEEQQKIIKQNNLKGYHSCTAAHYVMLAKQRLESIVDN